MTVEKATEEIEKLGSLRFKDFEKPKSNSLEDFIKKEFFELNSKHSSINGKGEIECDANRDRSLVDIYRICKYYYPDSTLLQIKKIILTVKDINSIRCGQVQRRVYYLHSKYGKTRSNAHHDPEQRDEFGWELETELKSENE